LDIDLNLFDGGKHQVVLYFLDWDNSGRAEAISILNASTMAVIDGPRTISSFQNGRYRSRDPSTAGDRGPECGGERVVPGSCGAISGEIHAVTNSCTVLGPGYQAEAAVRDSSRGYRCLVT